MLSRIRPSRWKRNGANIPQEEVAMLRYFLNQGVAAERKLEAMKHSRKIPSYGF